MKGRVIHKRREGSEGGLNNRPAESSEVGLLDRETDEKTDEKPWLLSVASVHKVTKELHVVRYKFVSDATTVEEALEAVYSAGFACVQKVLSRVVSTGSLSGRVSNGEL